MNKKISLYKKIGIFRGYKKTLRTIKTELEQVFGARIDNAWRIYNVINIPEDVIGEPYNLRKSDIDLIAENSIKDYTSEISKFLNSKGLQELYTFYEVKKVDKYSYLVVLGFSLFKSNEYYDTIRYRVIPSISIASFILLLILFLN
jgi:hypothetical protein